MDTAEPLYNLDNKMPVLKNRSQMMLLSFSDLLWEQVGDKNKSNDEEEKNLNNALHRHS